MKNELAVSGTSFGMTSLRRKSPSASDMRVAGLYEAAMAKANASDVVIGKAQTENADSMISEIVFRDYCSRIERLPILNQMRTPKNINDLLTVFKIKGMASDEKSVESFFKELHILEASIKSVFVYVCRNRRHPECYLGVCAQSAGEVSKLKRSVKKAQKNNFGREVKFSEMSDFGIRRLLGSMSDETYSVCSAISGVPMRTIDTGHLTKMMTSADSPVGVLYLAELVTDEEKGFLRMQYQHLTDILSVRPNEVEITSGEQSGKSRAVTAFYKQMQTKTKEVSREHKTGETTESGLLDGTDFMKIFKGGVRKIPHNLKHGVGTTPKLRNAVCLSVVGSVIGGVGGIFVPGLGPIGGAVLGGLGGACLTKKLSGSKTKTTEDTEGETVGASVGTETGQEQEQSVSEIIESGCHVRFKVSDERASDAIARIKVQKSRVGEGCKSWRWGAYLFAKDQSDINGVMVEIEDALHKSSDDAGMDTMVDRIWNESNPRRKSLGYVLSMSEHPRFALDMDGTLSETIASVLTESEIAKVMPL